MKLPYRLLNFFKDHFSVQGSVISVMTFALLGVGISLGSGWIFVLFSLLLSLIILSIVWPYADVKKIEAARSAPPRATIGETVRISLTLSNPTRRSRSLLTLRDEFLAESSQTVIERLPGNGSSTITIKKKCSRRGDFREGELIISSSGPFGLFRALKKLVVPSLTLVYPESYFLQEFERQKGASLSQTDFPLRRKGPGAGFYGIRRYQQGDALRSIHWRTTARTGELTIKEFEDEGHNPIEIVLDLRKSSSAGEQPDTTLEFMVKFAASVARHFLSQNVQVNLTGVCSKRPERVEAKSIETAFEWLAGVEADGSRDLNELLDRICIVHDSTVFIFTSDDLSLPLAEQLLPKNESYLVLIDASGWESSRLRPVLPSKGASLICERGRGVAECWRDLSRLTAE